jgi:hypothetical protein
MKISSENVSRRDELLQGAGLRRIGLSFGTTLAEIRGGELRRQKSDRRYLSRDLRDGDDHGSEG